MKTTNESVMPPFGPASADSSVAPHGFFNVLERLLRDREGLFDEIFAGKEIGTRLRWFISATLVLSACYGMTMGFIGFSQSISVGFLQSLTSALKVPVLFLLSLVVCFPVLYIVLVLMGVRLSLGQTLALILMALALNAVLLASCAPIVVFFVLTGSDYHFVKLLHVAGFAFSGGWAMMALWHGLSAVCEKTNLYPKQAVKILKIWILVFAFVGTQMAWSLRPFVGSPEFGYEVFRSGQSGNFYTAVWSSVLSLAKEAKQAVKE